MTGKADKLIMVVLDVTVSRQYWDITYGSDPVEDLPEYVAQIAASARRLRELSGTGDDGVPYRMLTPEVRTRPDTEARGFVTVRVAFLLEVDHTAWAAKYGIAAHDGVPAHVAAEVAGHRPLLEEVIGTVAAVPVPYSGGRVIGMDTMRAGRRR